MADGRMIRLKEMVLNRNDSLRPPDWYRKGCDDSLPEGPFPVRTDDNGFLLTGNGDRAHLPELTFVGDSFVESMFAEEPERFVSATERGLDAVGLQYNCRNAGYSGASSLQLTNLILNKIYPLGGSAQTVVLFGPQTDVHIYGAPATYWADSERYAPVHPPVAPKPEHIVRGFEATTRVLDISLHATKVLGMRTILATSPFRSAPEGTDTWLSGHLGDGYSTVLARREMYSDAVRRAARDFDVPLLDAAAEFKDQPELFYDELHLNNKGQAVFSEWLTGRLADILSQPE